MIVGVLWSAYLWPGLAGLWVVLALAAVVGPPERRRVRP
jgi:hypothetical protein